MKITPTSKRPFSGNSPWIGPYDSAKYLTVSADGAVYGGNEQDRYAEAVSRIVEYAQFDVLHAHDWLTLRAAMAAKMKTNKPLIVHIHATEYDRAGGKEGNPFVRDIEHHGMMMADQVIAVSNHTKKVIIEQYGIPEDKIAVVHNRMELVYEELSHESSYKYLDQARRSGYRVVVSAGRLTIQKGLTTLIETMALVISKRPKTLLLVVGTGEQYHELIELAAAKGISANVLFTGHLDGTGKHWRDAFRAGDLFVMPSVSEPFGVAPLEAIGYGTPVLMSKTVGAGELLNHVLKVDFWDTHEMANQIVAALRDEALLSELQRNSFLEYQRLSWTDAARSVRQIYDNPKQKVVA